MVPVRFHIHTSRLLRSLAGTCISLALCFLLYTVLDVNVLDHLAPQDDEADVINYFYSIENRGPDTEAYSCFYDDRIVLFDLEGEKSRAAIAEAIERIDACAPAAILLDVIFPAAATTDTAEDRRLRNAVTEARNLYAACRLTDGETERSFFVTDGNIPEGLVNRLTYFRPAETEEGDTIPYLPYLATGTTGTPDPYRTVNYFDKEFFTTGISQPLLPDDIRGRFVLVGDLKDLRDTHDMPFRIGGTHRVPGTVLLAHTLSTILHDTWVVKLAPVWGAAAAFVLTFLFTYFCYAVRESRRLHPRWANFIESAARILLIVLLMLAGYCLFSKYGVVLNLVYTMFALALTGFAADIVELAGWVRGRHRTRKRSGRTKKTQQMKRTIRKMLGLLVSLFLAGTLSAQSYRVASVNGDAHCLRAGQWDALTPRETLSAEDIVRIGKHSVLSVIDRDGNRLYALKEQEEAPLAEIIEAQRRSALGRFATNFLRALTRGDTENQPRSDRILQRPQRRRSHPCRRRHPRLPVGLPPVDGAGGRTDRSGNQRPRPDGPTFLFRITNRGDIPLFVNVLDIASDGSLYDCLPIDEGGTMLHLLVPGNSTVDFRQYPMEFSEPAGTDLLVLTAYDRPFDLRRVAEALGMNRPADASPDGVGIFRMPLEVTNP